MAPVIPTTERMWFEHVNTLVNIKIAGRPAQAMVVQPLTPDRQVRRYGKVYKAGELIVLLSHVKNGKHQSYVYRRPSEIELIS